MNVDIIGGKDTKFTDAVSLSFHGAEEAMFSLFHKVILHKIIPTDTDLFHFYRITPTGV